MSDYTALHAFLVRRRLATVGAAALVAAALVGGGAWWGRSTAETASTEPTFARVPHGPLRIVDGVPSGFTRDGAGAASAAVAFLQVCWSAPTGAVDSERIRVVTLAEDPSAAAIELTGTSAASGPDPGWAQQLTPTAVEVASVDANAAVVQVWAVALYGANDGAGRPVTSAQWSTATVTLAWQQEDWKVLDVGVEPGPEPGAVGAGFVPLPGALTVFHG